MSQQPEQTSLPLAPHPTPAPVAKPVAQKSKHAPQRIPSWLVRGELFLRIFLRIYLGLAICYMPWSGEIAASYPNVLNYLPWSRALWDQNPLFAYFPALGLFAAHGAVRGLVSGLGLLNLWFAFHDALHHWDG